ncbi:MAG: hypothetical protein JKY12_07550, partial [Sneathiella sp.]|nr:hypothetical protein [Sneathiella sp.]
EKSAEAISTPTEAAASISEDTAKTEQEATSKDEPASTEQKQDQKKKELPRNLPFKPTHEMLSLVGTTREQFTLILENLGYEAKGEGEELTYQKISFKKRKRAQQPSSANRNQSKKKGAPQNKTPFRKAAPAKAKEIDPHSPFAVLKNLNTK